MGDFDHHRRLAIEKRAAVHGEFGSGRYSVVGDLAIKAVEQAIEALASLEELHFHVDPRTAHAKRFSWVKSRVPELSGYMDELWGGYGLLGYEGGDGEVARRVVEAMENVFKKLEERYRVRFE